MMILCRRDGREGTLKRGEGRGTTEEGAEEEAAERKSCSSGTWT